MDKQKNVVPEWFKYDSAGNLDVDATLAVAPAVLDKKCTFFRDIPEWFEVGPSAEVDETIKQIKNAKPEEKKNMTDAEITDLLENLQRMRSYIDVYNRSGLSGSQKELLRALCYWASVKVMAEIPDEDEE